MTMRIKPERKAYPVTVETVRSLLKERDELLAQNADLRNENETLKASYKDLKEKHDVLLEESVRLQFFWKNR
jgi:cell division protein FtsB